MKTAVVTGTSSGIGQEIAAMLLKEGYKVYGLSRRVSTLSYDDNYYHIKCDLRRYQDIEKAVSMIKQSETIDLLINNAGVGFFGPHEEVNPQKLHDMVTVNLEAPLILTQLLLREIKKSAGTIINISSVTAEQNNTYGCAYGATKAGLASFSASLFDEVRKYGVRVVNIEPDMTRSEFYDRANFCEGDTEDTYLEAEEVAAAIRSILQLREGAVVTKLVLRPQRHRITKK